MKRREYIPTKEQDGNAKGLAKNAANAIFNVRAGGKWYVVNLANDAEEVLMDRQEIIAKEMAEINNGEREGSLNILSRYFHMIDREIVRRGKGQGRQELLHAKRFYDAAFEVLTDEEIDRVVSRMAATKAQAAE